MAKPAVAVIATAVILTMTSACGAARAAQGLGTLGVVSQAPSLGTTPSQLPSAMPSLTVRPSSGGGHGNGGGGHGGGSSPAPNPDTDPGPRPDSPPPSGPVQITDRDYAASIEPAGGPRCYWTILGDGRSVYDFFVSTTYTGPTTDPDVGYVINDGDGNVFQTGTIGVNTSFKEFQITDPVVRTNDYTETLVFSVDAPGIDMNPRDNTTSVDMKIPVRSVAAVVDNLQQVTCSM